MEKENNLDKLKQYALERDVFCDIFKDSMNINELWKIIPYESYDFKVWYWEDEYYFLHKPSGTLINYYKHLGRVNTCNKNLTIKEFKEFSKMLREDIFDEIDYRGV